MQAADLLLRWRSQPWGKLYPEAHTSGRTCEPVGAGWEGRVVRHTSDGSIWHYADLVLSSSPGWAASCSSSVWCESHLVAEIVVYIMQSPRTCPRIYSPLVVWRLNFFSVSLTLQYCPAVWTTGSVFRGSGFVVLAKRNQSPC